MTHKPKSGKITYKQLQGDEMIKLSLVTMKDGEINVEEKEDLSKLLTDNMEGLREKHVDEVSVLTQKLKKTSKEMLSNSIEEARQKHVDEVFKSRTVKSKLPKGFYLNDQNSEFFTGTLESMVHTITDESKKWKIEKRLKEGNFFGTFRRFKTTQPTLVKAYKTRKGAENNTFWRNH